MSKDWSYFVRNSLLKLRFCFKSSNSIARIFSRGLNLSLSRYGFVGACGENYATCGMSCFDGGR
jgi:hypothetical protein